MKLEVVADQLLPIQVYEQNDDIVACCQTIPHQTTVLHLPLDPNIVRIRFGTCLVPTTVEYKLSVGSADIIAATKVTMGCCQNTDFVFAKSYIANLLKQFKPSLWIQILLHLKDNWYKYLGGTAALVKLIETAIQHIRISLIYAPPRIRS